MSVRISYWPGNAAKSTVIDEILGDANGASVTVFDHGCGDGGDWARVLSDHPNVELVAWDPDQTAAERAAARLAGHKANISVGHFPEGARADVAVSFSVLEHVHDRPAYLAQARSVLSSGGRFFLNYDDGHFRTVFDPDEPFSAALANTRVLLHNRLAGLLARFGRVAHYQKRVSIAEVGELVTRAGFRVGRSWYHNLDAFKWLSKHVPEAQRSEFTTFWREVEDRLNRDFDVPLTSPQRGDPAALWQIAGSRTVELTAVGD
jgi:SAM-dependent methyltransferase